MEALNDLNEEQREAVEHGDGPLLVIAGAGTGKTKVITHRIARLIEKGVMPGNILALTFTEKAAAEMEERVDRLTPYGYTNVWISTFHSFGDRILRDNALSLGLPPDYKILTEPECIIFLKEHLFSLPFDYYRPAGDPSKYLSAFIRFVGRLKDEDITPEEFLSYVERLKDRGPGDGGGGGGGDEKSFMDFLREKTELARAYSRYEELKAKNGYLDFGDLVVLTLRLLRSRPQALKRCRERFLHILTDEFQDTNYAQFELLKMIAGERKNITVVADDDQSIYKFRGAAVSNVLNFLKEYPLAKLVTLKENYRSVQPILDASYRLITNNNPDRLEVKSGIDKRLRSSRPMREGCGVKHQHFDTITREADFVAGTISERVSNSGASYRDFAVLVRARNDARPFLSALDSMGIPYRFSGNSGLFTRDEITLFISFLKCITDFSDSLSLFHLASSPIYGLGAEDLVPLNNLSRRTHCPLYAVMKDVRDGRVLDRTLSLTPGGLETIKRLVNGIERFSALSLRETAGRVLYSFLNESGYMQRLVGEPTERAAEEVRNIARFFEIISHMEETLPVVRKAAVLVEELRLLIEAGENPGTAEPDMESDAVSVLTVHKAKGLEFPAVFMVGLVSDRFPRREKKDQIEPPEELIKDLLPSGDFHIQEERRLFYVGMTRAMDELFLLSSSDCGGVRAKKKSTFLLEALDTPKAQTVKTDPLEAIRKMGTRSMRAASTDKALEQIHETGEIQLSFYQIDDYLTCPLKYKYVHVLKIPLLPHHTIIYGSAVHSAVSFCLRRRLEGLETTLDDLIGVFKNSWKSTGFVSREHELVRFNTGLESLRRFYEGAGGFKPLAVEREFNVKAGNNLLKGRWDLIAEREGSPYIIDFKTSEMRDEAKAHKRAKESLQLQLYTLAFREVFGALPAGCELHFFESGLVGRAAFGDKEITKALSSMDEAGKGIRRRDFQARPDYLNCSWCAFNNICPEKFKTVTSAGI